MADVATNNTTQLEPNFTELELEHPVEGDITIPGAQDEDAEPSTLDEPVYDTVMRDVYAVGIKFWHVLYPRQSKTLLKEWDLWGPLILCTLMAILLQGSTEDGEDSKDSGDKAGKIEFSQVFGLLAFGAVSVALNSKLLGGSLSVFQSLCVLGYCILPLVLSLIIGEILGFFTSADKENKHLALMISRIVLTLGACVWSTIASLAFLADSQPQHRKVLALYPICLFYFVISWMILAGE
ncbi:Protein YIPF6 [Holothuria leucospilota]|uniref:Protein YIPF n=1 Tax=Holothuria leucospilota TaxID=206669 RepID=A0A9Q1BJW3_HOLLE|nr:Protein YIPF6 [Holothuria leucospilota]